MRTSGTLPRLQSKLFGNKDLVGIKRVASALSVGILFAIGLGVSGMTNPAKVIGFLDLFGQWDPALMFVMLGALSVHFITYRLVRKRSTPLLDIKWHVPTKTEITPALVIGSALFGIGWGLAGYCPGPAIASLGYGRLEPAVFVAALLAGMYLFKLFDKKFQMRK